MKLLLILLSCIFCSFCASAQQNDMDSVFNLRNAAQDVYDKKDYNQFLVYGDSILKISPANEIMLGYCYNVAMYNLKDTLAGIKYLKQDFSYHPFSKEFLINYGCFLLLQKKVDEALPICKSAYELDRHSLFAIVNYAHSLFVKGNKVEANKIYTEALELTTSLEGYVNNQQAHFILLNKLFPSAGFEELKKQQDKKTEDALINYKTANQLSVEYENLLNANSSTIEQIVKKLKEALSAELSSYPLRNNKISDQTGRLAYNAYHSGDMTAGLQNYNAAIGYDLAIADYETAGKRYNNIGTIYKNIRLLDSAFNAYGKGAYYFSIVHNEIEIAHSYYGAALVLKVNGENEAALKLIKDSVLTKELLYNDHEGLINTYEFIAGYLSDSKSFDSSKIYLEKAIKISKLNCLPDVSLKGVYTLLADAEIRAENFFRAKQYLLQVDALIPPHERNTLQNITNNFNVGHFYFIMKNYDSARFYLEKCVGILFKIRKTLSAKAKLSLISSESDPFSYLAACYYHLKNYEGVFKTIEQSKTLLLADKMGADTAKFLSIKELQQSMSEKQVYYISSYTNQNGLSERKIIMVIDKHNVQAKILSDSMFLVNAGKISYGPYLDTILTRLKRTWTNNQTNTLKSKEFMIFALYMQIELEKARGQVRGVGADDENEEKAVTNNAKNIGKILYSELLKPFEEILKDKKELIVLSDGFLSFVPFESLVDEKEKYLIEKMNVSYLPSIRIGQFLQQRQKKYSGSKIALIGDPVFRKLSSDDFGVGVREAYMSANAINWSQLPGTEKELATIKNLFQQNMTLSKENCTEEKVKELFGNSTQSYKLVHFATHGFVMDGNADLSAVILNQTPATKEDGYLTANEIESLKIPADIVVLSACQTGKGMIVSGEGVQGLSSSFFVAGANALIVSMWSVSDNSTQIFMQKIYEMVKKENTTFKDAVGKIKKRFLAGEFGKEYQKPYYWAPFIYIGN